jgi:flagellar biosynthesis component FlhA/type III secretion system FlhB-like substrate exporter
MCKNNNSNKLSFDSYYPHTENDPIEITFGYNLIPVFDKGRGRKFQIKIRNIRKQIASEWGVIIPEIRMRDDTSLEPNEYIIKIQSATVCRFTFCKNCLVGLTDDPDTFRSKIKCEEFSDPIFGIKCFWIKKHDKTKAEMNGAKVLNITSVIAAHLSQSIKSNLDNIISCDDISKLLNHIRWNIPVLINEIENNEISIGHISVIIRKLLSNCIPINNLPRILELINEAWIIDKEIQSVNSYVLSRLLEIKHPIYNNKKKKVNHSEEIDESEIKSRPYEVAVLGSTFCGIILKYDRSTMNAPQIIMKRSGSRIYELIISAITANLPVVNNSDAAQTIFRSYEEGDEIEEEMYSSVALLYAKLLSTRQSLTHDIH